MLDSGGVAIATVHSILIVINIVGNCLVCAIIKKHRDMRTPMNYLLVNLAVADTLYAAFIAPDVFFWLTSTHPHGIPGTVLCKLLTSVAWAGSASSIVTLVAIAIERYYAVVYPLGNKWELTKRKLKVIVLGSWIFAFMFCLPTLITKDVKNNACADMWPQSWLIKAKKWMWFGLIVLSIALMIGFYSRVVYTLWFKSNDDQLTNQQKGVLRVRKRVTLMVVAVTAIFGICWLTDTVTHLIDNNTSYTINKHVYTVIHTMILVSSSVNPFVYALINQNFRQKIKRMMCFARCTAGIHPATQKTDSTEAAQATQPTHTPGPCSSN